MVGITEESVFHYNGRTSFRVKILQFRDKMRKWNPGKPVILKHFSAMDCVFMLKVYPNGYQQSHKGHVSIYLTNQTKEKLHVKASIQLGGTIEYIDHTFDKRSEATVNVDRTLSQETLVGFSHFFPHPGGFIGDDEDDEDERLAITCHISEVWKQSEFKSPYLVTKETFDEVKNLKGTMNQLDSRQEKISKIFGNSASRTMEMSVKVEDISSKLETVSEMANNVEDVKRLITELNKHH